MSIYPSLLATAPAPVCITSDLVTRWLSFADVKPLTLKAYVVAVRDFLSYLRQKDITMPIREDIMNWRDSLLQSHKAGTVRLYLSAVKIFFAWTDAEGLYKDISRHIRPPKESTDHKKDALTPAMARAVIAHKKEAGTDIGTLRDTAILLLMTTCGLRCCEVVRADISDFRTKSDKTVLFTQGKGHDSKDALVIIPERTAAAIRQYLSARQDASPEQPLFIGNGNKSRGRLTERHISRIVKSSLISAGYNSDRLTAHSLRHTAASIAISAGQSLEDIQQALRHQQITTTQIYAHEASILRNTVSQTVESLI